VTTRIRRPGDFTNTFSKDECGLIQAVLKEITNHLDKVGHSDLRSTKVHISGPVDPLSTINNGTLPRPAVVESIVKRLARSGWVATFHKAEYGFHIVLKDDRITFPSDPGESISEEELQEFAAVVATAAPKREWGC
jgi:hypothetical protein|tara:strand:- start:667 stop:1074 length:408 start_codon:yes stop_codon:yes gene_type:complete